LLLSSRMSDAWQTDPHSLEELFRALVLRRRLIPQPDRRGGGDRRRVARGGRRAGDHTNGEPRDGAELAKSLGHDPYADPRR
jgi:hypothetical protein